MGCLLTILGAVALFFLGIGINGIVNPHRGDVIAEMSVGLIFVAISVLIFHFIRQVFKKAAKSKEDFYIFCGGKDNVKYEDYSGDISGAVGIALNVNTQTLFMKDEKIVKSYPFAAIRDWESGKDARTNASYFMVHVKDVDNPEWKLPGIPGKKWFEILNQEINES